VGENEGVVVGGELFRFNKGVSGKNAERGAVDKASSTMPSPAAQGATASRSPYAAADAKEHEGEIYFSMERMKKAVQDVNSIATRGQMKLTKSGNMHKLELQRSLDLCFYKNGIFFKNGPLRPYAMPECQAFVKDILDGYFPYELKEEFPGGVGTCVCVSVCVYIYVCVCGIFPMN
jgi:hypothetical protein